MERHARTGKTISRIACQSLPPKAGSLFVALNGLGGAKSIGGCTWKASTPHQRQAQAPSTLSPQYPSGVWMECRGAPRPAPQPARDDISCYGQKLSVASAWPGAATVPTRPPSAEADPSMNAFFVAQCRGADGQPPRTPHASAPAPVPDRR